MSQIRPPEDDMPGRGTGYQIAMLGLMIGGIIFIVMFVLTQLFR